MSAQPSLDRLANSSIEIVDHSGDMYSDGWMTPSFSIRFRALADIERFVIRLWNPDFAARYFNNHITIMVDDVSRVSPALSPGQLMSFKHQTVIYKGDICAVDVVSEQSCEPDGLDNRLRGVIFVGASFSASEDQPEADEAVNPHDDGDRGTEG